MAEYRWVPSKVATRDINFGISIKVPQKVDLKISGLIFLCLFLPSKWAQKDNLDRKKVRGR